MKEFLRCLLLPVDNNIWLLPYSAVAEVLEMEFQANVDKISWRGIELPVLRFKEENSVENKKNMAILNRCSEGAKDFFGLILSGVPSMQRFKRSDIEWVAKGTEPHILMEVKVRNQSALIPNLSMF